MSKSIRRKQADKFTKNKHVRLLVWRRCRGKCFVCKKFMKFESIGSRPPWDSNNPEFYVNGYKSIVFSVDHINPVSKGGLDHVDNLQGLCITCNKSKGATT